MKDWFEGASSSKQGLLGELKARFWLTHLGYDTCSPDAVHVPYDLLAVKDRRVYKVQVKTSRCKGGSNGQFAVNLVTTGGNTKVNTRKHIDGNDVDLLFVMVSNGRCWLIPFNEIDARTSITVGGTKWTNHELLF